MRPNITLWALLGMCLGAVGCTQIQKPIAESELYDTVENPFPGATYIFKHSSTPNRSYVLKIDLTHPDIFVMTTREADRKKTVSAFAAEYDCQAAINGDFFDYSNYKTVGLAAGGGKVWSQSSDGPNWGFMGFGLDNRVLFSPPAENVGQPPEWVYSAIGGNPLVLENGQLLDAKNTDCGPHFCARAPRSGMGISQDGKTLFLAVIDGRRQDSVGATTLEIGLVMQRNGAWRGINLDGGGSSAMFIKGRGIVNFPSDGSERVVANHIGICKGKPEDQAARRAFFAAKN